MLGTIAMERIAVAVWTREPCADFCAWLHDLPEQYLPSLDTLVAVQHVEQAVTAACDLAGTPMSYNRQQLCRDVAELAQIFAEIVEQPFLRLRLDRFRSRSDGKFHMGNVRARLFCSYKGVEIDFGAAEVNGIPRQSRRIPLAMPAMFRGLMWDGIELSRVVHRPAPMKQPGEVSLLLIIDPAKCAIAGSSSSSAIWSVRFLPTALPPAWHAQWAGSRYASWRAEEVEHRRLGSEANLDAPVRALLWCRHHVAFVLKGWEHIFQR